MWQAYVEALLFCRLRCVVNSEVLLDLITPLCCCERKSENQSHTRTRARTHAHTHTHTHTDIINLRLTRLYIFPLQETASLDTTADFTYTKTSACCWTNNTFTITHSHVNTLHFSWGETTYFSPLQHWGGWERETWQRIFLLTRNPPRRDPEAVRRVSSPLSLSSLSLPLSSLSLLYTHTKKDSSYTEPPEYTSVLL